MTCLFYFSFFFLLNLLGWHWLIKLHRFQVYNSIIHHLYVALCVYHPKSNLLSSWLLKVIILLLKYVLVPSSYLLQLNSLGGAKVGLQLRVCETQSLFCKAAFPPPCIHPSRLMGVRVVLKLTMLGKEPLLDFLMRSVGIYEIVTLGK